MKNDDLLDLLAFKMAMGTLFHIPQGPSWGEDRADMNYLHQEWLEGRLNFRAFCQWDYAYDFINRLEDISLASQLETLYAAHQIQLRRIVDRLASGEQVDRDCLEVRKMAFVSFCYVPMDLAEDEMNEAMKNPDFMARQWGLRPNAKMSFDAASTMGACVNGVYSSISELIEFY